MKKPKGCKCDSTSWRGLKEIPPVCDIRVAPRAASGSHCPHCEHDDYCHVGKTPPAEAEKGEGA